METTIKYRETIQLADGHVATLKLEEYTSGDLREYHVSLFTASTKRLIANAVFPEDLEAKAHYIRLRNKYHASHTSRNYAQLAEDLQAAVNYSQKYVNAETSNISDSNQSTVYLILNGWDEEAVIAAAKFAGVTCSKNLHAGSAVYIIGSPRATRDAESICDYLEACGYIARVSYTLD